MGARTVALLASLALLGVLAYLTISVAVRDGITPLVVLSLALLALIGIGVVGALGSPPSE